MESWFLFLDHLLPFLQITIPIFEESSQNYNANGIDNSEQSQKNDSFLVGRNGVGLLKNGPYMPSLTQSNMGKWMRYIAIEILPRNCIILVFRNLGDSFSHEAAFHHLIFSQNGEAKFLKLIKDMDRTVIKAIKSRGELKF